MKPVLLLSEPTLETPELAPATREPSPPQGPFDSAPASLRGALTKRGFQDLTSVQRAVLEATGQRRDFQISSETGSGKTVALGMLLVERLGESAGESKGKGRAVAQPRALVLTPTRELAAQVKEELGWLFAELRELSVAVVTGGTSVQGERRLLQRGPAIVVGTPGRLLDHIKSGTLDCTAIQQVILDEADQMLDMGFREELESILEATPAERGTHMMSATFPPAIVDLARRFQQQPMHIEGTALGEVNADIEHVVHLSYDRSPYRALVNVLLMGGGERTLVFVKTRADAASIAEDLVRDGFTARPLSGELQQAQRTRTLEAFKSDSVQILVATDVAARGLDIRDVATVIQASAPEDAEAYVHRSGRTGRAGRKGRSLLLVPARFERRARQLLRGAGVEAEWLPAPNADDVRRALRKRSRRLLYEAIDGESERTPENLEFARKLVGDRDPLQVVATLLDQARSRLPREPYDLQAADTLPRNDRERGKDKKNGFDRGRPTSRPKEARTTRGLSSEGEWFTVNWGFKNGGNPSRLLAMICRRGGLSSSSVGTIKIGTHSTAFEVIPQGNIHDIERRFRKPCTRDPHLRITRPRGRGRF